MLGGWLSVGGNLSHLNARDNVKTLNAGSRQTNLTYGTRLPNLPYLYAGTDMVLIWPNIDRRGGKLSLTYDNLYQHSFPLYAENLGSKDSKEMVPEQFAHNLTAAYNFAGGRFSLAVECRNLTNAKLYDNYSLQKPGRAFFCHGACGFRTRPCGPTQITQALK